MSAGAQLLVLGILVGILFIVLGGAGKSRVGVAIGILMLIATAIVALTPSLMDSIPGKIFPT